MLSVTSKRMGQLELSSSSGEDRVIALKVFIGKGRLFYNLFGRKLSIVRLPRGGICRCAPRRLGVKRKDICAFFVSRTKCG